MNAKQTKKPIQKLKIKQTEIIEQLLKFRHLQQPQIQQLLNHKHKERIRIWLNELVDKHFLFRIYEKEVGGKPSEYCLDKESVSYLKEKGTSGRLLKRIYKEKTNSQAFREKSEFLVTIYLSLLELTKKTKATLSFNTKDDLRNIKYLILPHPDCYFAITEKTGSIQRYFLDIFQDEKYMYKRFYQYDYYFKKQYWQKHSAKSFPTIILICPIEKARGKLYGFMKKKLNENSPVFYLSTWDDIQTKGLNKETLQKVNTK